MGEPGNLVRFVARLVLILALFFPASAGAEVLCDVAKAQGVDGCVAKQITLFSMPVEGPGSITSDAFKLDPSLVYWICCAADPAGNASPALEQGVYLVKIRAGTEVIEHCAESMNTPDEGYALWSETGGSAALYGWSGPPGDPTALCTSPHVTPDARATAVGTAWLISVPAANMEDE